MIDIKDWHIEIQSDLYLAGHTEDGEPYSAEMYSVVAVRNDGKRLMHGSSFKGCIISHDDECGMIHFSDVRDIAKRNVEILKCRIIEVGVIDPMYWHEIDPVYGSDYYILNYMTHGQCFPKP